MHGVTKEHGGWSVTRRGGVVGSTFQGSMTVEKLQFRSC